MHKNCLKSNHVFKFYVNVMSEKFVQTQVRKIPSLLQFVVTCIISPCNNAIFLTPARTVLPRTLLRCFHLSTFLSFFPLLCAVVKNSDCESTRWPLLNNGNWNEFVSTYWILDVVQCCFSSFCLENGRIFSNTKNVVKISLSLDILLQISYATGTR